MYTAVTVIILIICGLLALVVLAQNPKGGGLAAGFTGAQQIGGVQRTADFLEKATWSLSGALMVLCLISAGIQTNAKAGSKLDDPIEQQAGEAAGEEVQGEEAAEGEGDDAESGL
ncbi:MAG: preprotein translocase subunit SecG [Flavobacteriales bacterium]|nr:preprotein translocase subunit SecG [Flavobacteriales bacterium]MBK8228891.1 preprotein translocase subunit SecG [Flavobacteriales bacterium]